MNIANLFRLPFRSRSRKGRSPSRRSTASVRPAIEALEDRTLMSVTLNWVNEGFVAGRGDSDNFKAALGDNAARGRQVIHTALQEWQSVIYRLNRHDASVPERLQNAIDVTISILSDGSGGGADTTNYSFDANGIPTAATITINQFGTSAGQAWYLDPNLWSSAFLGTPTNAFAGYAKIGSAVANQSDLLEVVTHELGHAMGFKAKRDDTGAISPVTALCTDTKTIDNSSGDGGTHGKGDFWAFTGTGGFTALLTAFNSGLGGDSDAGGGNHFAPADASWTDPTTKVTYFGADDLMNPYYSSGQRRIVSLEDADVLRDAYGYSVNEPAQVLGTFYSVLDETGTLTLRGRQDVSSSDTLTLSNETYQIGATTYYSVHTGVHLGTPAPGTGYSDFYGYGYAADFDAQNVKFIVIQTGAGKSTVNLSAAFAQIPISIGNGGPAAVNVGTGVPSVVAGKITIANTVGKTDLTIDGSGGENRTVSVDQFLFLGRIYFDRISGLLDATVSYREGDVGTLVLKTGQKTEHVNVSAVRATEVDVVSNSASAYTTYVTLGSTGTLSSINAPVYLWATSGKINLTVDDSADGNGHNVVLAKQFLSPAGPRPGGLYGTISYLAPYTIRYRASDVASQPDIKTGSGVNLITIPQATVPIRLIANSNNTTVNVGAGSLNGILANITILATPGNHANLVIDDSQSAADQFFTLDNGSISWAGGSVISSGVADVTLNAGAGQNIFTVEGTLAGTTTTLNGGTGFNEFEVGGANGTMDSLQGALALHAQPGSAYAVLYDAFNPAGQTYTFTAGLVTRTGMAPITYDGLGELVLATSKLVSNTINVQSNAAAVSLFLDVWSGDTVYLGQPLNDGSGTATLANIAGTVGVVAPTFTPTVIVDNSADTSAHAVTTGKDPYGVYLDGLAPGRLYFTTDPADQVQVKSGGDVSGLDAFFALLAQQVPL
jgi:hypothetical protein